MRGGGVVARCVDRGDCRRLGKGAASNKGQEEQGAEESHGPGSIGAEIRIAENGGQMPDAGGRYERENFNKTFLVMSASR